MIWMIERIKTFLLLQEETCILNVPITVEVEYQLVNNTVSYTSVSKKIYYNRSLLIKEASCRSETDIDALVNESVEKAIERHFCSRRYIIVKDSEDLKSSPDEEPRENGSIILN